MKTFFGNKIRAILGSVLKRPYYVWKKFWIERAIKHNEKITIVYTIGKVGSVSVYKQITYHDGIQMPVFHVHALNRERIESQKRYYLESARGSFPLHLTRGEILSKALEDFNGKLYLITLFREPIGREISSIYQDALNFFPVGVPDNSKLPVVLNRKMTSLVSRLPEDEWIHREPLERFGLNLYDVNFDPAEGYGLYEQNNIKGAVVRLENLEDSLERVLFELYGVRQKERVVQRNSSNRKYYRDSYKETRGSFRLNKESIDRILSSRFIRKFYPDMAIEIRERWQD